MSQTSLGDFFYKLKITTDQASFNKGVSEVERVAKSISGLAKTAVAATAATKLLKTAFDLTAESRMARQIGISTQNLDKWKTAANIAGVSANGLAASMANLENKMQHLKMGQVDMGMAKGLGMLGIGYGDFADMNPEQRMAAVFNQADQMKDQQLAATLVGDILGQAGLDYYNSLKLSGKSLSQQLAEAKSLNFVSDRNRQSAARFAAEMKSVQSAGASIAKLLGAEIAEQLTPTVNKIKNMLITNRNAIIRGVQGIARTTGAVVNGVGGIIAKAGPFVTGLIDKFGGLDKMIVKIGIGFGTWKLMQVTANVSKLVKAIGGIKGALSLTGAGLKGMGLFLILDDLFAYFSGGGSVIGEIINSEGVQKLMKALDLNGLTEKGEKMFKSLSNGLKTFTGEGIKTAVQLLSDICSIVADLCNLDWDSAGKNLQKFFVHFGEGLKNMTGGKGMTDAEILKENDPSAPFKNIFSAGGVLVKAMFGDKEASDAIFNWAYTSTGGKKQNSKDGIISPNGTLTQVAPDDWVVAFKNVGDLASAFVPQGTNVSAPASINIQQTFNVEGGRDIPAVIKAQAYRGTSEALQQNVKNATRILQLMPGTK